MWRHLLRRRMARQGVRPGTRCWPPDRGARLGWTGGGRLPLVVDAGSCTLGLTREVLPYLTASNRVLHST